MMDFTAYLPVFEPRRENTKQLGLPGVRITEGLIRLTSCDF